MTDIQFKLNNEEVVIHVDPASRLLDVLRQNFKLIGVKEGCGEGECGACAVLINHKIVNACITPVGLVRNKEVVTIEGFSYTKRGKVLRKAFEEEGAVQCGFCTPGMLIAAESLLHENPHPTPDAIREGLSGNLCRCTGYNMIIKAVQKAAERGDGLW